MTDFKHQFIRAGAGAGKTSTLIQAVIDSVTGYFEKHGAFPKVAVSTFTRKATRELKERLIIKAMALNNPDLIQYICYSPRLQISTLHGLFYNFIQSQAIPIGFSPGLSIMDEKESYEILISLLKDVLLEQKKGIELLDHYSFAEISLMASQYVLPEVLYIDRSPVSQQEMASLIAEKKALIESALKVKKTKQKENTLLSLEREQKNLDKFFALNQALKTLGQELLTLSWLKKKELNKLSLSDLESVVWDIITQSRSDRTQLHPFSVGLRPRLAGTGNQVIPPSADNLAQSRSDRNQSHPFSVGLRPRLAGTGWDFLFLDEYQDTSLMQKKILDLLGQNSQTFIVGDPQQSIYYFRGADDRVFLKKEQEMNRDPHSEIKCLNRNYRSSPELVTFFNDFFSEKKYQKMEAMRDSVSLSHPAIRFMLLETGDEEQEFLEATSSIDKLISHGVLPEDIVVLARQNNFLRKLAQHLNQRGHIPFHLHSSGGFTNRREVKDALFLWRFLLNPHEDENLIGLLRTPYARVPDSLIASGMKEQLKHTLKSTLPKDKADLKGESNISFWQFLLEQERVSGVADNLVQSGIDKKELHPAPRFAGTDEVVLALKQVLEVSQKSGLVEGFKQALFSLGFMDLSYYQDPTGVGEANLWKLIYSLKKQEGRDSLLAFSDGLFYGQGTIEEGIDPAPSSQNALSALKSAGVQLMTIHSAKGLEFKHVILIKVCSGFRAGDSFPYLACDRNTGHFALKMRFEEEDKREESVFHKKVKEETKEKELLEFDRLLYVAMTRAQESLTLIGSGKPEKDSWPQRFSGFPKPQSLKIKA